MAGVEKKNNTLKRKVLIVDDDRALRKLIIKTLNKNNFDVLEAATGEAAIREIDEDSSLLLLLDQKLPDMTGRDIVDSLSEKGKKVPFVVMTGQGDERLAVDMMKYGALDYLIKDMELLDILPGVLNRVFRNIETENRLKAAEEALKESEKRFRSIFENTESIGVQGYNKDRKVIYWNKASENFYGYKCREVLGERLEDLIIPDEIRDDVVKGISRWINEGIPIPASELELKRSDGSKIVVFSNHVMIKNKNNEPEMYCIDIDLTQQKQTEADLKKALEKNEALLNANPDMMFVFDAECNIVDCHPKVRTKEHYTDPNVFLGKNVDEILPSDISILTRKSVESVLKNKVSEYSTYNLEVNGEIQYFEARHVPSGDDEVLAIVRNITDQVKTENEREKLQHQLTQSQKMESVGRLAGGVAHDFNNMLSVIIGYTQLSLERIDSYNPLYSNLQEVKKAAERSANLTKQLLAFARKQTITPKVFDLNEAVGGMYKMLIRLIGEDIDLVWLPNEEPMMIEVDPSQIDQILANLCVNARDAIKDTGKITIETSNIVIDEEYCKENSSFVPGDYIVLSVSDDGSGMDNETLSHLFEPFYTTKEIGRGTGLGMATVYGIIKQNNGFITVDSEVGKGTTINMYLPRYKDKKEQQEENSLNLTDIKGHETILLVEDEPAILAMTTKMLEAVGYTVIKAESPVDAIELAKENIGDIHLLITDVIMPEMNGRDLAKSILFIYPDIKRLFMSGYTASVIAHHGVLNEGVNFIHKPFNFEDLVKKVREVLDS